MSLLTNRTILFYLVTYFTVMVDPAPDHLKNVSIGVVIDPPYAYPLFDNISSANQKPGFGIELSLLVCKLLALNCKFIVVNHTDYGVINADKTWNGLIGQILNGDFDTSLPIFNPTEGRRRVLDFAVTLNFESFRPSALAADGIVLKICC